ncbi:MAG TPA: glycosyl hydrolase [Candidatus Polarisedimenticolia bacterium]|nr:glycosyl hydrolase [Candidatus Polarisedimenticolia bacterium]
MTSPTHSTVHCSRGRLFAVRVLFAVCAFHSICALGDSQLETGWTNPPAEARLRAYWWWLNGNVTTQSITRDLEGMKAKGFGGAVLIDADGSSQDGNARAPHGPTFFSPEWRELYKYTLREADRLGLEISLNIQSGWNLGGPMVTPDDAPKKLVWTQQSAGTNSSIIHLAQSRGRDNFYRDLCVLAYRINPDLPANRKPLENQQQKALIRALEPFSAPVSTPLFQEYPSTPNEQDARVAEVVDLSSKLAPDGTLDWKVPDGNWQVLRFGFTLNDQCRVSTCSEGWDGYAIDPFDAGAFRRYWDAVVEPLIADAGPLAGKSLKYLHTDSWEIEVANWTPTLREEFKKRRGYDLLPWLPVVAGKIINSRDESDRFLADFRRTLGDLAIDNHYKLFREGAHRHGLLIHPESGGPHAVPIDAQQCLGFDDLPMSEFWAWSWTHRIGDQNRFFVKQPASAAHTYGHKFVWAEGFTTIGPHWQERLWDNLKPSFDYACTEGMNVLVWHAFVCSPESEGIPGQQYFAGTHLNPNVTWWGKSAPFFSYINRCQWMLQQGLPVADVAYYYGDHVPNFAQLRKSDPAHVGAGYDYDVATAEVILNRMSVKNGRLVLPDGMSYRLLVLPDRNVISLPVLRKLKQLADAGATILGPRPASASGLTDFPASDAEVKQLADDLWGHERVLAGLTARDVLASRNIKPDFECESRDSTKPEINFIHRRDGDADIYFVASRSTNEVALNCTFRVAGKAPELWDPMTGGHRFAAAYTQSEGLTKIPLRLGPCGSQFIVFREPAGAHPATAERNETDFRTLTELSGPWTVAFDPKWGGPDTVEFDSLVGWTTRSEPGIKYYSGTAVYRKNFEIPAGLTNQSIQIDLGVVRELAEVKVNGQSCGIVWAPPFQVDISRAVKPGVNHLEVEVVNFWPNRIIGDQSLPESRRFTRTNIRKLTSKTPLMASGLMGPVRILVSKRSRRDVVLAGRGYSRAVVRR